MWRERVHTAFEEQWENLVNIGDGRELYFVGNESGQSHLFTRQQTPGYLLGARCVPAAWATKVATVGAESGGEAQDLAAGEVRALPWSVYVFGSCRCFEEESSML